MQKNKKQKTELFDIFVIIKYLILTVVFACISYGIELIVISACKQSPTGKCGNGILSLFEVHNTGAAFGLFQNQPELVVTASFLALALIIICIVFLSGKLSAQSTSALSILSAGIVMNLVERLNLGYVVDYISMDFLPDFPVFNTADILIVIGAICLLLSVFSKR